MLEFLKNCKYVSKVIPYYKQNPPKKENIKTEENTMSACSNYQKNKDDEETSSLESLESDNSTETE